MNVPIRKDDYKKLRCAFPGCILKNARPRNKCFECQVPLCIQTTGENVLDSCFYFYHTVKNLSTAVKLREGIIDKLDDHRYSGDESESDT